MGKKRSTRLFYIYLYIIIILASITFITPLYWLVRSSLMDLAQIFTLPPQWIPNPFILSNYPEAWNSLPFGRFFVNTGVIVVTTVIATIATSSMAAFGFARIRWPFQNLIFGIILTSMMLPFAVTIIPTFIGWKLLGFVDTFIPLILPSCFGGGAFSIFLLRQFFLTIPKELDQSAKVDGASYFVIYSRIILPLSKPALISVGLFTFIHQWNDFLGPLIYLNDTNKFTLSLGLRMFQGWFNAQWGYMMAAAVIVTAPALVIFLLGQKYFVEGITTTGLKG